jgi:hypothetical protein
MAPRRASARTLALRTVALDCLMAPLLMLIACGRERIGARSVARVPAG